MSVSFHAVGFFVPSPCSDFVSPILPLARREASFLSAVGASCCTTCDHCPSASTEGSSSSSHFPPPFSSYLLSSGRALGSLQFRRSSQFLLSSPFFSPPFSLTSLSLLSTGRDRNLSSLPSAAQVNLFKLSLPCHTLRLKATSKGH